MMHDRAVAWTVDCDGSVRCAPFAFGVVEVGARAAEIALAFLAYRRDEFNRALQSMAYVRCVQHVGESKHGRKPATVVADAWAVQLRPRLHDVQWRVVHEHGIEMRETNER